MKPLHNNFLANGICLSNVFHEELQNSVTEWLNWEGVFVDCPVQTPAQAELPAPDCPGLHTTRVQIPAMTESPQPLWTSHGKVEVVLLLF